MASLKLEKEDDRWREFSFLLMTRYLIYPTWIREWPLDDLTWVMSELCIPKENVPYLLGRLEELKKSSIVH